MNRLRAILSNRFYAAEVTMDGTGMGSMMTWMMGIGMLGWVLVIALLVTLVVVLARFLVERPAGERRRERDHDRIEPPA